MTKRRQKRRPITADDKRQLRRMAREGISTQEIALRLNRHAGTIHKLRSTLRLRLRDGVERWAAADRSLLIEMSKKGCGPAEIARALNRPLGSVKALRHRLGLAQKARTPSRPWTKREDRKLRAFLNSRIDAQSVLRVLPDRNWRSVRARITKLRKAGLFPPEPTVSEDEVVRTCEAMWAAGVKPTIKLLHRELNIGRRKIYKPFQLWRKTCGRSTMMLRRGPTAILTPQQLAPMLSDPLRKAPFTALDPKNDGRFKPPPEGLVRYLSTIEKQAIRDICSLYALHKPTTSSRTFASAFNSLWSKLCEEDASLDDPCDVDAEAFALEVLNGHRGRLLTEFQRLNFIGYWNKVANALWDFQDQLKPELKPRYEPFILPRVGRSPALSKRRWWGVMKASQQEKVKAAVSALHEKFYRFRLIGAYRTNAVRRLHDAVLQAKREFDPNRHKFPFKFSYEETVKDARGNEYKRDVWLELWDARTLFECALEAGYRAERDRLNKFRNGEWPPSDIPLMTRYLGPNDPRDPKNSQHWIMELVDADILGYVDIRETDGVIGERNRRRLQFNQKWGYRERREWSAPGGMMTFDWSIRSVVHFMFRRGYRFIRPDGLYITSLLGNVLLRLQTICGARIGEVMQIAATKECIKLLENVGPRKASRWLIRLVPKGRKEQSDFFVDDDSMKLIGELIGELRRVYESRELPVVAAFFRKTPPDKYVFQWNRLALRPNDLNVSLRILLHGEMPLDAAGRAVEVRSHLFRHLFATEAKRLGIDTDVLRQLLHQKDVSATEYYSQATTNMVRASAELIFVDRIDIGASIRRTPAELRSMLEEAQGKVGALTEVVGGICVISSMCPAKFVCIGCPGNVPDPAKREQVITRRKWAVEQSEYSSDRGLLQDKRQADKVIENCDAMLEEMSTIEDARRDAEQKISITVVD